MRKKNKSIAEPGATPSDSANGLTAPPSALDAALTSLFATSSGPVKLPITPSANPLHSSTITKRDTASLTNSGKVGQENDALSRQSSTLESPSDNSSTAVAKSRSDDEAPPEPARKRRRIAPVGDIEGHYMKKLAEEETRSSSIAQVEGRPADAINAAKHQGSAELAEAEVAGETNEIPQHESLIGQQQDDTDKSGRTVFLANVSIEAIKSKIARKTLLKHLSSCLPKSKTEGTIHKIESLRFRSTAFASGVGPKRAAYAKRELMEETTHSTNAYVVYTSYEAAKKAATILNGTIMLDRHLRVDLVAKPAEIDHRRCVFVGNLGFVDEEMVKMETEGGNKERRRKAREPADAEEGLWRTFSKAGKVESVRVVRDKSTRVGKGFAYVQFYDENGVEAALLYNDKKFPPLLPRKLRVTRARKPKKIVNDASREHGKRTDATDTAQARTVNRLHRKSTIQGGRSDDTKKKASFVFEGYRATKPDADTARSGKKKRKHASKPTTRSSRRGAAFKAAGGKRQRK